MEVSSLPPGIPVISKDRAERVEAIAQYLAKGEHNIVCLQEVWSEKDFIQIRNAAQEVLPYAHYFYSGVLGSGLCILSKWFIEDIFFHQWPLNGYIHKVQHGDWFGGKGVGLCRIRCHDRLINVYCTHLHAEYHTDDMYISHRVLQAYNTAEFVRLTEASADVVIVAGDFNTEPGNLSYRLLSDLPTLEDPRTNNPQDMGTSDCVRNSYSVSESVAIYPKGKAIDHIFYRTGRNVKAKVTKFGFPLPERVEGKQFSYSDHEAICLELKITSEVTSETVRNPNTVRTTLTETLSVFKEAITVVNTTKRNFYIFGLSGLVLLLSTAGIWEGSYSMIIFRLSLSGLLFYFLLMGSLWSRMEVNALKGVIYAVENSINGLNRHSKLSEQI